MREIKFRVYDKKLKKMIHRPVLGEPKKDNIQKNKFGNLIPELYKNEIRALDIVIDTEGNIYIIDCYGHYESIETIGFKDRYIIMQYIGRKDKNGREIYEEDLVKITSADNFKIIGVIKWNRRGFYELWYNFHNGVYETDYFERFTYGKWCIEVIGNIYENPKLLE